MKTKILVYTIAIMLFGAISTGYGKPPKEAKVIDYPARAISKIINKSLHYPDFGYEKSLYGNVDILFTLTAEGTVSIKRISSENEELKSYVKDLISKLDFNKISYPIGQLYGIKIAFWPD
jgi:hypothetical protein